MGRGTSTATTASTGFQAALTRARSTTPAKALERLREYAPHLETQSLNLGDLFGRLFHEGQVQKSSDKHSPVAQVTEWLGQSLLPPGQSLTVTDRPYEGYSPGGVPLTLTVKEYDGGTTRSWSADFLGVRSQQAGQVRLPSNDGVGSLDDWSAYAEDIGSLLATAKL